MPLNRIYTVDFTKLLTWLTPVDLRMQKLLAFVSALVAPIGSLYNSFIVYANGVDYWLHINSQVCFMEKALNDKYDISLRRIYIADAVEYDAVPLFLKAENKPLKLYKKSEGIHKVFYTKGETAAFTVDFIVFVPAGLVFDNTEMTVFVGSIKLPTKTFQIKTV